MEVKDEFGDLVVSANWIKLMKNQSSDYKYNLEYLRRYRENGDEASLEWLICNNANLVHKIVGTYRTFYKHKLDYDDLFSVGLAGLMRAVEKFDFSFENNFGTYATYWIRRSVVRCISDEGFTIKIPTHIFETLHQVVRCEMEDDVADREGVCSRVGISEDKYELVKQVRCHMLKWRSLNSPISQDDDTEFGDLIDSTGNGTGLSIFADYDVEGNLERKELGLAIEECLDFLNDRERIVIKFRFGLFGETAHTLTEIGRKEGVSRERIRQIEVRALAKLRQVMGDYRGYLS